MTLTKYPRFTNPQATNILYSLYQLTQVSNDPTRLVTETTSTLIDLILTNKAENISCAGVLHLSISDHSLDMQNLNYLSLDHL